SGCSTRRARVGDGSPATNRRAGGGRRQALDAVRMGHERGPVARAVSGLVVIAADGRPAPVGTLEGARVSGTTVERWLTAAAIGGGGPGDGEEERHHEKQTGEENPTSCAHQKLLFLNR